MLEADPVGKLIAGVDGTKKGWAVVALEDGAFLLAELLSSFGEVLERHAEADVVAVDIPIGLPGGPEPRQADVQAKRFLASKGSSVFPTPARAVLEALSHKEATALAVQLTGKGISQQSFALRRKILEVDALVAKRVVEVHPEVSFKAMADGAVLPSKKTWSGIMMRRSLLANAGIHLPDDPGDAGAMPADDLLDAAAAAWSGSRYAQGEALSLPEEPPIDQRGRQVAIWY